jgi:hypothetical protein
MGTRLASNDLPGIRLPSWSAFLSQVEQLPKGTPLKQRVLFRGQFNADWELLPPLLRYLGNVRSRSDAEELERAVQFQFFAQAHLYATPSIMRLLDTPHDLERWALMQHYGVPTRLLDWTQSAFVAAYFAAESGSDADGAIFVVRPDLVNGEQGVEDFETMTGASLQALEARGVRLFFFWANPKTERQVAQMGHFSVSPNVLQPHADAIAQCLRPGTPARGHNVIAAKWILPKTLKLEFLSRLREMNVAPHSLFPGLDGLGRSLRDLLRLETGA